MPSYEKKYRLPLQNLFSAVDRRGLFAAARASAKQACPQGAEAESLLNCIKAKVLEIPLEELSRNSFSTGSVVYLGAVRDYPAAGSGEALKLSATVCTPAGAELATLVCRYVNTKGSKFEKLRPRFNCIAISKNSSGFLHCDPNNLSFNYIFSFGSYRKGGELFLLQNGGLDKMVLPTGQTACNVKKMEDGRARYRDGDEVEGTLVDTRKIKEALHFDATKPHLVRPVEDKGDKLSLILYTRKGSTSDDLEMDLQTLGFSLPL